MVTRQQAGTAVGAHLVGGLKCADAETAMRTAAEILGGHLRAIPDGETGDRSQWIFWQIDKLTALDGVQLAGTHGTEASDNRDYSVFPALSVDASVTEIPPRALGYADAAEASYATFRRLRDEGVIPEGVRFQVSIPTPYATVVAWVREPDQERFLPIYADAIAAEVAEITRVVGVDDLALQYDVAVEIGALTGNFATAGDLADKPVVLGALREVFDRTPDGPERVLHLCYGDYKHRHFTQPQDLSLCVEMANAVGDAADVVHMPVDRDAGRRTEYFHPLRDLGAVNLALGVIDYEGDAQRTRELAEAATAGSGGREFAVATECGLARIDERGTGAPTLERLLELHAEVATPIR
jgi:hypothetical protein